MLLDLFLVCFSLIFPSLFHVVPCSGLSWLLVSFLLHVKYTVSYLIARYYQWWASAVTLDLSSSCMPYFVFLQRMPLLEVVQPERQLALDGYKGKVRE